MNGEVRNICIVAAVLGLFFCGSVSQAETLQEAVGYTIRTNPEIRAGAYNRLARDQEVRQAFSAYYPTFDVMGGIGYLDAEEPVEDEFEPKEVTLSLRQNVFTGLATKNEVARQESRVLSQAYRIRSISDNTALRTAQVYLEVLRKQELHELARENLTNHERIGDQIKLRSESGLDRRSDNEQVNSRLNLARSNVVITETNLIDAQTNYLAVVGHLPENLVKPETADSYMPVSLEEAEQMAINAHPSLKGALADFDARKSQAKVANAPYWPVVDIEVDKNWSEDTSYTFEKQDDLIAMLRLRYNLFHGFRDQARKAETRHLVSEALETRNNTHRQVIEGIRLSWMAYKSVQDRIQYLQERVANATATANSYSKQWDIGQRTLLDVLDTEAEQIEAKRDLLEAEYDGLYAQYRILNSMGMLVPSMNMEWPEEALVENEVEYMPAEEADQG
ncbi:MAG: TolC family outer membrane protein [Desulfobulbaceae bacterium]|nr:TolC family outer membrane protein [Desulfobulbaceae bacterium]